MTYRCWRPEEIAWGATRCESGCGRLAEGTIDGVPLNTVCAGELFEWWGAVDLNPAYAEMATDPWTRWLEDHRQ